MASYSSSNYSNALYDLSGIYFNSTSSSSTSDIDLTTLDERYLKLSGGTISNNLIISNSLDVQTSLTLPIIGNVETEIQAKQDIINDGDLTIAKTTNLQSSLDTLQTNIDLKLDVINDGDLTIAKTNNLQSSLDTLTSNIDLKQDTLSNLEINGNVNLDTSGTSFDTLVIRRVNGISGFTDNAINLTEVQIWVNNENLLVENSSTLTSFFSSWSDKETDIGFQTGTPASNVYDYNTTDFTNWALSPSDSPSDVALIIKNIPMTKINNIQSIQIINATFSSYGNRAIGLTVELYNSVNDTSYAKILAQSSEITAKWSVYRFDGPSYDTYTLTGYGIYGLYPNTGGYSSLVSIEDLTVFSFSFNIIGSMDIDGDLTGTTITALETNITSNYNNLVSILETIDIITNFVGGGVNFRAIRDSNITINTVGNVAFNTVDFDTDSAYDNSDPNYTYTIPIDGTYLFTYSWTSVASSTALVSLIRQRASVDSVIQQNTNGTNTEAGTTYSGTTIDQCLVNDKIFIYLESGSITLSNTTITSPSSLTSFAGTRITN